MSDDAWGSPEGQVPLGDVVAGSGCATRAWTWLFAVGAMVQGSMGALALTVLGRVEGFPLGPVGVVIVVTFAALAATAVQLHRVGRAARKVALGGPIAPWLQAQVDLARTVVIGLAAYLVTGVYAVAGMASAGVIAAP